MFSKFPDFMASSSTKKSDSNRPRPLHTSRSFSRIEPASPKLSTRTQRASTIQHGIANKPTMSKVGVGSSRKDHIHKESSGSEDEDTEEEQTTGKLPADFDELPIELVSLTDRYLSYISIQ